MAVKDVAMRAAAYGFEGVVVDGNDVLGCYEASKRAVDRARHGGGPTLVEMKTYRFHPHTSDDDDRTYRSREEVEEAKRNDPIILFGAELKEAGILRDDDQIDALRAEIKQGVDAEVDAAWNAPDPDPATAAEHVFAGSVGPLAIPWGSSDGATAGPSLETTGGEATPAEAPRTQP
jgi:2-oxoisovalerate dehydrogenase E1 component alpha subunit